jgi:hypothetical protein
MNLSITVAGQREVLGTIGRLSDFSKRQVGDIIQAACLNVQREAKRAAPVDTGRLRSSINVRFIGRMAGEVGTSLPYAPAVEFGSGIHGERRRPYIIRPKRAKVLAWRPGSYGGGFGGGGMVFAREVKHPGVRPRPFLLPAWEREKEHVVPALKAAIERAARGVA